MAQQDSPIPMQDDSKKQPPSNAIELHDEGLKNLYNVIQKQRAKEAKKKLKKLEVELHKLDTDQDNE